MKALIMITYMIYIICYETLIVGGCGYVVFFLGHSGWWFVLAGIFSAAAYSPKKWGKAINQFINP
jgi:hypothetical protein